MKSIQTKFISLILGCVLLCSAVIGGSGIINAKQVVDKDSAMIMNLLCSEKAKEMDTLFKCIEQSVKTLAAYTSEQIKGLETLSQNEGYAEEVIQKLENVAVNAANNTDGSVAVYVHFNPAFKMTPRGLFLTRNSLDKQFERFTLTDLSLYSPDDIEHVGWYYLPIQNGKPTWIEPYMNKNINVYMISYVIPIIRDNVPICVVGMDIDFQSITTATSNIHVYKTGYAFLSDKDASLLYHKDFHIGMPIDQIDRSLEPVVVELANGTSGSDLFSYSWNGEAKKLAFRTLSNGMRLGITAPVSEIDADKNALLLQFILAALAIALLFVVFSSLLAKRIIKPLRELNTAAQKIAEGDLSISLTCRTNDEVGTLADSFQKTVKHLQKYIDYINGLAYRDSLTGVKNKAAYQDVVNRLDEQIRLGRPEFGIIVFDINGLKPVNDTYGHDFGDMLIIDACKLICKTFKHSPVFRIGGDEFVVLLEGSDYAHYQELLTALEAAIAENNRTARPESQVSIARGVAIYGSETDLVFGNVFKRADEAMYKNKAVMKQALLDRNNASHDAK